MSGNLSMETRVDIHKSICTGLVNVKRLSDVSNSFMRKLYLHFKWVQVYM